MYHFQIMLLNNENVLIKDYLNLYTKCYKWKVKSIMKNIFIFIELNPTTFHSEIISQLNNRKCILKNITFKLVKSNIISKVNILITHLIIKNWNYKDRLLCNWKLSRPLGRPIGKNFHRLQFLFRKRRTSSPQNRYRCDFARSVAIIQLRKKSNEKKKKEIPGARFA